MKYLLNTFLLFITTIAVAQDEVPTRFNEGVQLLKAKRYAEAEQKFTQAIEDGKPLRGLKMAYIYKGYSLNGQEMYDSAIASFNKAIEIDPVDPASYIDRGKTYYFKGDYGKARLDFENVLQLDTSGQQAEAAYYYLGRLEMTQRKNKEAIQYFDKLLVLVPTDAEGYFLRGTAKSNVMDIDGSIKDFDLAIKFHSSYAEAYANRGVQKINRVPTSEKIGKKIDCLTEPCADLLKAKQFGDKSVDDMIFLYCQKCK